MSTLPLFVMMVEIWNKRYICNQFQTKLDQGLLHLDQGVPGSILHDGSQSWQRGGGRRHVPGVSHHPLAGDDDDNDINDEDDSDNDFDLDDDDDGRRVLRRTSGS